MFFLFFCLWFWGEFDLDFFFFFFIKMLLNESRLPSPCDEACADQLQWPWRAVHALTLQVHVLLYFSSFWFLWQMFLMGGITDGSITWCSDNSEIVHSDEILRVWCMTGHWVLPLNKYTVMCAFVRLVVFFITVLWINTFIHYSLHVCVFCAVVILMKRKWISIACMNGFTSDSSLAFTAPIFIVSEKLLFLIQ